MHHKLPISFGRFVFQVMFSSTVSVFVSYGHKAASPVATERFPAVKFSGL